MFKPSNMTGRLVDLSMLSKACKDKDLGMINQILSEIPLDKSLGYPSDHQVDIFPFFGSCWQVDFLHNKNKPENNLVFDSIIELIKNIEFIDNKIFYLIRKFQVYCYYKTKEIVNELLKKKSLYVFNGIKKIIEKSSIPIDLEKKILKFLNLDFDTRIEELWTLSKIIEKNIRVYKIISTSQGNWSRIDTADLFFKFDTTNFYDLDKELKYSLANHDPLIKFKKYGKNYDEE